MVVLDLRWFVCLTKSEKRAAMENATFQFSAAAVFLVLWVWKRCSSQAMWILVRNGHDIYRCEPTRSRKRDVK